MNCMHMLAMVAIGAVFVGTSDADEIVVEWRRTIGLADSGETASAIGRMPGGGYALAGTKSRLHSTSGMVAALWLLNAECQLQSTHTFGEPTDYAGGLGVGSSSLLLMSRNRIRVLSLNGDSTGVFLPSDEDVRDFSMLSKLGNGDFLTSEWNWIDEQSMSSVIRLSPNGVERWTTPIDTPHVTSFTSAVEVGDDIVAVGLCKPPVPAPRRVIVVRLTEGGLVRWVKPYGLPGTLEAAGIVALPGGGFNVVVETSGGSAADTTTLLRLDADGDSVWTKALPNSPLSVVRTGPNRMLVVGCLEETGHSRKPFFMLTDDDGAIVDSMTYDSGDWTRGVAPTGDGAWVVAGGTRVSGGDAVVYRLRIDGATRTVKPTSAGGSGRATAASGKVAVFDIRGRLMGIDHTSAVANGAVRLGTSGAHGAAGVYVFGERR